MPISQARLRTCKLELQRRVDGNAQELVVETELEPGERQIQSWFLDETGEYPTRAHYVEVEQLITQIRGTDPSCLCPTTDSSYIGGKSNSTPVPGLFRVTATSRLVSRKTLPLEAKAMQGNLMEAQPRARVRRTSKRR